MRQQFIFCILCYIHFLYFVLQINYAIRILLSAGITIYFFLPVIHFFPYVHYNKFHLLIVNTSHVIFSFPFPQSDHQCMFCKALPDILL